MKVEKTADIIKQQLMAAIGPEITQIEGAMRKDLQGTLEGADPLLVEILEYGLFNGGKRLRPLLVVLASRLCGLYGSTIYEMAIAFEYLHAATLFHDDVIDHADIRRGKASVKKKFGEIAAILGGDFLHSHSMFLIGSHLGAQGLKIFCTATNAMVDGEFLQLRNARNSNLSVDDYYNVVRGKTALLLAATCEIGALAAGASGKQQQVLREYGLGLGTAFQIIDDLLDYQGVTSQTGKAVGNDFHEEKMTLPLILALNAANSSDRKRLLFLLENEKARSAGFQEAFGIIEKYNGFSLSREQAETLIVQALSGLSVFSDESAVHFIDILHALAGYVLSRDK